MSALRGRRRAPARPRPCGRAFATSLCGLVIPAPCRSLTRSRPRRSRAPSGICTTPVYADQGRIDEPHVWAHAERLGIAVDRLEADRRDPAVIERVEGDVRSALRAGAATTPTLFIDGEIHFGPPELDSLRKITQGTPRSRVGSFVLALHFSMAARSPGGLK